MIASVPKGMLRAFVLRTCSNNVVAPVYYQIGIPDLRTCRAEFFDYLVGYSGTSRKLVEDFLKRLLDAID
jgi:hypothetical protein